MFISQEGRLPFPKVDPIRLPEIVSMGKAYLNEVKLTNDVPMIKTDMNRLENSYRNWFSPLIDTSMFPHMYFMSNGITQALETLAIHYKKQDINLKQGDYFWLRLLGSGKEVENITECSVSYSTTPSAIDGNINNETWPSAQHILDCAYVGTSTSTINVPNNTEFLLLGFNKNIGLVELRCGLLLSKKPIPSLQGLQKTFGHVGLTNHYVIEQIIKNISITELATKLKHYQTKFCREVNMDFIPSDSALIATTNSEMKFYQRPNGATRIPLGESISRLLETDKSWL